MIEFRIYSNIVAKIQNVNFSLEAHHLNVEHLNKRFIITYRNPKLLNIILIFVAKLIKTFSLSSSNLTYYG